ncbi:hypothetical protein [Ligilactobacillus acidipiscis]|uniref:hypothetical protein n=1 Tax=Ligilactobacillus acidipiscis TaxID=89059 RepID=UPI0023F68C2F|nr:hypothetical protein [Ligilactobacillus acidipiscis]WEV56148.1 hypothetical protein OZX66_07780 [Ligilactobacillus acidipiscis]
MIKHGKNDNRIRFEMRDRIQEIAKYMDKKYGENCWANDERACVDPQLVTLQLWLGNHATSFEENFNSPDWQRVYELRMRGAGQAQIAETLGITKSKVASRLRSMKVHHKLDNAKPIRKKKKVQRNRNLAYPKPSRKELIKLVDNGMNKTSIAKKLGVGRKLLYRWLKSDDLMEYSKKANYQRR